MLNWSTLRSLVCAAIVPTLCTAGCWQGVDLDGDADGGGTGGEGTGEGDEGDGDPPARGTSPGIRLLTQREFRNAVRDLLGVEIERTRIPKEQLVDGHGHIAHGQGVGIEEVEQYYELALEAAEQAVPTLDPGCDVGTLTCAQGYAEDFLERAFRQPLTAELRDPYLAVLDAPEAGDSTSDRLATLLATALTSPHFLYRRELGDELVDDQSHTRWLTDYEIAARLSFLLWQSGPDDALLTAARNGELRDPDTRNVHLQRLLADDRARVGQLGFAVDWIGSEAGSTIDDKDPEVLAGVSAQLAAHAERSLERTIEHVLFDGAGTFSGLLSTGEYWVEQEVAELLGLSPAGSALESRSLDPAVRRGVLMHPAVLAAHTKESGASPFPIGKFIYENVLCETIGPPAPNLPEVDTGELDNKTLRELLEELTKPAACQGCHSRIGPPGFAFLSYDPIGRHSFDDGYGRPFDTTGTIPVGEDDVSFANAAELSEALAAHENTEQCIARRLYRWTYGHFEEEDAAPYLEHLSAAAAETGTAVDGLLSTVVVSDEFAQVRREE